MKLMIIFPVLFLCGCDAQNNSGNASEDQPKVIGQCIVGDSSLYSKKFINNLMAINDSNNIVSLIDTIIIYNGDTAYFPQYLAKGEQYAFSKKNDSENYLLLLTRNNLTSVSFDITFNTKQGTFHFHGIAELNHGFFFAKGSHEDDTSGISYGVDEYFLEDRNYIYMINPGINAEKKIVADFFIHTLAHAKDSIQNKSYISPTLRLQ